MNYIIAKSKGKQNKKYLQYSKKRVKNKTPKNTKIKTSVPKLNLYKSKNTTKNKSKYTTPKMPYVRRQDQSTGALENLLNQGYDMVTFEARPAACPICHQMNGTTWTLQEFLDTTEYEASIFSHIHCQCLDEVRVWSSNFSLPTVYVDWTGRIR